MRKRLLTQSRQCQPSSCRTGPGKKPPWTRESQIVSLEDLSKIAQNRTGTKFLPPKEDWHLSRLFHDIVLNDCEKDDTTSGRRLAHIVTAHIGIVLAVLEIPVWRLPSWIGCGRLDPIHVHCRSCVHWSN